MFLRQFHMMGTICVALFFFFLGYGLLKQLNNQGNSYLEKFFNKRFNKILPAFIIATLLYTSYVVLTKGWLIVYDRFIHGYPPLPTSWFVYAISWFYVEFYIVARLVKNRVMFNILMLLVTGIYCFVVLFVFKWGGWWVNAAFAFNLGIAAASFEKDILSFSLGMKK